MATTRLFYSRALLRACNFQTSPVYEQALIAVMTGEDSTAHWNPMDTTLNLRAATPYNSFGPDGAYHVWNYSTAEEGIAATKATLEQGNMLRFATAMRRPDQTVEALCRAFSLTPWGGIGDVLPLEIAQEWTSGHRKYEPDWHALVSGPGPWPYQANGQPQC